MILPASPSVPLVRNAPAVPLARHPLFHSTDVDEARGTIARVFKDADHRVVRSGERVAAIMNHAPVGEVSFNYLAYGAAVDVDPDRLQDFFLVMLPLEGRADMHLGAERFMSSRDVAACLSPHLRLRMRFDEHYRSVIVWIRRAALERHLASHLGADLRAPIAFAPGVQLRAPGGRFWHDTVLNCVNQIELLADTAAFPLVMAQMQSMVLSALLHAQPSNYREALLAPPRTIAPASVRRVEEYIEAHLADPLTIERLAEVAGTSVRTLFANFERHRGTTPMAHLRAERLKRVRQALASGAPDARSVATVAMRWGFSHLGHFSAAYREKFGETPSETMRAAALERAR